MQKQIEGEWTTDIAGPYRGGIAVVDIAVVDFDRNQILLGRKPRKTDWRLPGGFVDHTDRNYEFAARRELGEEAPNIEAQIVQYVQSYKVDDPRYVNDKRRAFTSLFLFQYIYGDTRAGDDLVELKWVSLSDFYLYHKEILVPEHIPFVKKLIEVIDIVKGRKA